MRQQFLAFGESSESAVSKRAQATIAALGLVRGFELVELRSAVIDGLSADVIVVDSINDQVPTRNIAGIRTRERLALVFPHDEAQAPSVRALRRDFPIVMHLNHVPQGQPASLCLYQEPWSATERTWTPQKYLRRILWWTSGAAQGTLHPADQPVEQLYFESLYELVLPPNWEKGLADPQLALLLRAMPPAGLKAKVLIRAVFERVPPGCTNEQPWVVLPIALEPVQHGRVLEFPETLGVLDQQLKSRGATNFFDALRGSVATQDYGGGVRLLDEQRCILLVTVPVRRTASGLPEATSCFALLVTTPPSRPLALLGKQLGVLQDTQDGSGRYFKVELLAGGSAPTDWLDTPIAPLSVRFANDVPRVRQMSGIEVSTADFAGVLAGAGALGGMLADIWTREAWGTWTFIDPDYVAAHNVARHVARDIDIGHSKVNAVKRLVDAAYQGNYRRVVAIVASAQDPACANAIESANFLVDASTTLDVPRDLVQRKDGPRCASVFITPSGKASVLLLEDGARRTRLDSVEAQYYRAIVNEPWGAEHLVGNSGELWVGAGCRDVSLVISHGMVQLHAGILSRQVRLLRDLSSSTIRVWAVGDDCQVHAITVVVEDASEAVYGGWRVLWDAGTAKKLKALRFAALPEETGGVVLGYVDHKTSTIAVVDVLPAPSDSIGDASGFDRGSEGLLDAVRAIAKRTANIVGYIGEWHSHPPLVRPEPSTDDKRQLAYLVDALKRDGEPALLAIVGSDGEVTLTVGTSDEPA